MDVDASFGEYVAARWSTLHRLATLLVGPDAADDLTSTALVRAYLSWADVRAASSPDGEVQRFLVAAALAGDDAAGLGTPPEDGRAIPSTGPEALWQQVAALPVRQRALLVLRHYDLLTDAEIAGALGSATAAVTSETRALETGMDVAELRRQLLRRSEADMVPHPPIDALLLAAHEERRRRRRRAGTWVAGVAAGIAAVLVLVNLLDGTPAPTTRPAAAEPTTRFLAMLPDGPPSRVAWSEGRSVHLGNGRELRLAEPPTALVQTRSWLLVVSLSGRILRVDPDTGQVVTIARSQGGLVTDQAGTHAAWLAPGEPALVVARTLADGTVPVSDEQEFPARPTCCDNPFVVVGMTADGLVVAAQPARDRTWVWSTPDGGADEVRAVQGLGTAAVSQVGPGGVVVRTQSAGFLLGRLEDDRFVRTAALRARQVDFTDPLGHRVLYADDDGELHVREVRSLGRSRRGPQDVRLGLPELSEGFSTARWEDAGHLLLDLADVSLPHGALVRCAVADGACELATRFERAHLVAD